MGKEGEGKSLHVLCKGGQLVFSDSCCVLGLSASSQMITQWDLPFL